MSKKTNNLNLILPNTNAENWGNALNSNFTKIDESYTSILSRVSTIQSDLGNMNYIYFTEGQDFVKLNSPNQDYITVGKLGNGTDFIPKVIYYLNTPIAKIELPQYSYKEILDFSGFYIYEDFTASSSLMPIPYNKVWKQTQILVKTSKIEESNNVKIVNFVSFPQSLGGYYVPSQTVGSSIITFTKTTPLKASDSYPIEIMPSAIDAAWEDIILLNNTQYPLITYIDPTRLPQIQIEYYEKITETKFQKIEIDYDYEYIDGKWNIITKVDSLWIGDIGKYTMRILRFTGK